MDGSLLLDGGYLNNLPADVMHRLWSGALGRVIACDVGSVYDTELYNYGDELSGWWLLLRRLNPLARPIRVRLLHRSFLFCSVLLSLHRDRHELHDLYE